MSSKPKCKYWDSCFQTNEIHKNKFLHPENKGKTEEDDGKKEQEDEEKGHTGQHNTDTDDEKLDTLAKTKPTKRPVRLIHTLSVSDNEEERRPTKKLKVETPKKAHSNRARSVSPSPSSSSESKPRCRYWEKCFRKEMDHLKAYLHPFYFENGKKKDIKPKNELKSGEHTDLQFGEKTYTIRRTGDHYYCNCVSWKIQNTPVSWRTCKHLRHHLGDKFEDLRVSQMAEEQTITRAPKHIATPSLLLAKKWDSSSVNPKDWWLSEKLDGVRAYWNGSTFYSRLGNEFIAPSWFIKDYPSEMTLDGELFGGRGKFQSTVSIVKTPGSSRWKEVTYQVFDSPSMKNKFEDRMQAIKDNFSTKMPASMVILDQEKCKGQEHLIEELERVEGLGGEGLMLREPKSLYEGFRSSTLLKVKTFYDAEAEVIGHEKSKSNPGVTGALVVRMECGTVFKVGSGLSGADRRKPPKKGTIISYKFQELTGSGKPRFPSYIGERLDMDGPKDAVIRKVKKEDE